MSPSSIAITCAILGRFSGVSCTHTNAIWITRNTSLWSSSCCKRSVGSRMSMGMPSTYLSQACHVPKCKVFIKNYNVIKSWQMLIFAKKFGSTMHNSNVYLSIFSMEFELKLSGKWWWIDLNLHQSQLPKGDTSLCQPKSVELEIINDCFLSFYYIYHIYRLNIWTFIIDINILINSKGKKKNPDVRSTPNLCLKNVCIFENINE